MIKCDIVILDSGICLEDITTYSSNIVGTMSMTGDKDIDDKVGHGTAIANIILNNAPKATAYLIKIFDINFECDSELFA